MGTDHPAHVAAFLAEVLGGPTTYSVKHGGHPRIIRLLLDRHLTQVKRRRWVELLLATADELDMPNDPEFRSALVSYLEWGSRLAVINSQPGAVASNRSTAIGSLPTLPASAYRDRTVMEAFPFVGANTHTELPPLPYALTTARHSSKRALRNLCSTSARSRSLESSWPSSHMSRSPPSGVTRGMASRKLSNTGKRSRSSFPMERSAACTRPAP
jgi:hypothetical protein